MSKKGNMYVISAPSGAGKDTILGKILAEDKDIGLSVSATTRKPREGEINGVHYYFLTVEEFEEKISKNELLEYAKYAGNYYGTPLEYINKSLDNGKDVIVEIEVQGAESVRKVRPDAYQIFIMPPSFEVLESRLRGRGTDDEESIKKRLEIAKGEILEKDKFDITIINDKLEEACNELLEIIRQRRN